MKNAQRRPRIGATRRQALREMHAISQTRAGRRRGFSERVLPSVIRKFLVPGQALRKPIPE